MYHIFIVEDDSTIAGSLARHLEGWDYRVSVAEDFKNIQGEFIEKKPDLVLLDIGLPFYNGFYWCTRIREISDVPILFLSSADDNMNIVMAMNMGGDAFVEKPFDLHVLTAKIQAVLRRAYAYRGSASVMEHRGCVLNLSDATVSYGEQKTELTRNELKIFQCLLEKAGRIVSREEIMARLWESDAFIDENTLTVNVGRLRRKLAGIGLEHAVVTRKGIGYMVEA